MRDYGRVYTQVWDSETIAELSDAGQLMAFYLMTCRHGSIAGVFRLPDGYISADARTAGKPWSAERIRSAFAELSANGFAKRCDRTGWVWIVKHLEFNRPENPNQAKAAAKVAMQVPDGCAWKDEFLAAAGPTLGVPANRSGTVPEPFRNREITVSKPVAVAVTGAVVDAAEADASTASKRGHRLPADWQPSELELRWAIDARPDIDAKREAESFRDYWCAKSGKDATKLDWVATWRNWVRNARPATGSRFGNSPQPPIRKQKPL